VSVPATGGASIRSALLAAAMRAIGTPYIWGGTTLMGFDCSGLVQWAYQQVGISLPRTTWDQYDVVEHIPVADLRPGDLLFFRNTYPDPHSITHVGIYVGGGNMINAPDAGKPVTIMPALTGWWGDHLAGAGRPAALAVGDTGDGTLPVPYKPLPGGKPPGWQPAPAPALPDDCPGGRLWPGVPATAISLPGGGTIRPGALIPPGPCLPADLGVRTGWVVLGALLVVVGAVAIGSAGGDGG
jgi:hypothetical protein